MSQAPEIKIVGLHHVSIMTPDVPAALRFYTEDLGLSARSDRPNFRMDGAWLDVGGQQIHLVHGTSPTYEGQHFAIQVDDLDGAVAALRAKGYAVDDPKSTGVGRQTNVIDPCGNRVELNEPERPGRSPSPR